MILSQVALNPPPSPDPILAEAKSQSSGLTEVLLSSAVTHLPTQYGYPMSETHLNLPELCRNHRGTIKTSDKGGLKVISHRDGL